jgi:hypothetical protein
VIERTKSPTDHAGRAYLARVVGGLVIAVLLTCCVPSALAAEAGQIDGVVSEAATPHNLIAGIRVCAYPKGSEGSGPVSEGAGPEGGPEEEPPCATTNASGEYTISGLKVGEYIVEFFAPLGSGLNYVHQYYNGESTEASANPVTVSSTGATTGIDAQLVVGGQIAGIVTDASTGIAVEGAIVCAFSSVAQEIGGCASSGSGGAYTIPGLPDGEYKVGFLDGRTYALQYYDNKTSLAEANSVEVTQGSVTSAIDAALQPGAASSLIGKLTSPTGSEPTAPGLAPGEAGRPRVTILSRKLRLKGHSIDVRVACARAQCHGSIGLALRIDDGKLHISGALAVGSFSLGPGQRRVVALHVLGKKARAAVADARKHPVRVLLVMTVKGGNSLSKTALVR